MDKLERAVDNLTKTTDKCTETAKKVAEAEVSCNVKLVAICDALDRIIANLQYAMQNRKN